MTMLELTPKRRKACLADLDHTLELLALKLHLAKGARARDRIWREIEEAKRQRERLLCG